METWKPIPGTDNLYSASDLGRIRSEPISHKVGRQRGRILTPKENRKGYLVFRVCLLNQVQWQTTVHRAVALAFLGPCPDGFQVNHKDGNKKNNAPSNLEYCSCRENIRHGWQNGLFSSTHCSGEKNNKAKLTVEQVLQIRGLFTKHPLQAIANQFGVTKQAVDAIGKRKTWKHIPERGSQQ